MFVPALAQESSIDKIYTNDFEWWNSISTRYKVTDDFRVGLKCGLRFENNASEVSAMFSDFQFRYNVNKYFKPHLIHRFFNDNGSLGNRTSIGVSGRIYKFDRLVINYRSRFQARFRYQRRASKVFRNKITASYDIPKNKLTPFVAFEPFLSISNRGTYFTKNRLTIGADLNIPGSSELGAFYRLETESNVNSPAQNHIIGLTFSFTIDNPNL